MAGRSERLQLVSAKFDKVAVVQVNVGIGTACLGYHTFHVRQQLLQVARARDMIGMHVRVHWK